MNNFQVYLITLISSHKLPHLIMNLLFLLDRPADFNEREGDGNRNSLLGPIGMALATF